MPTELDAQNRHMSHYLALAALCVQNRDWVTLMYNESSIRLAANRLLEQLDDIGSMLKTTYTSEE